MKFLELVKTPLAIYHGCSTWKTLWEENSTPVNVASCGRRNIRKHRDIKNVEQWIILNMSYKLDCLDKKNFNSSESKDYMVRPGYRLTKYLDIRTKSSNKKQKARFDITDITNKDFSQLLKQFKNSPYIGYKSKQVHNEPTKSCFFQIKHITKLTKSNRHVQPNLV